MKNLIRLRLTAIALGFAAALVPSGRSSAQDPRRLSMPDSIPVELATALIVSGGIAGQPIILVGSMPEWLSSRITLPKSARVLGAASSGSTVVGVYSVQTSADTAVTELRAALLAHGWKYPPPPPTYGGGFRPATMTPQGQVTGPTTRATLCRDSDMLIVSGAPARGGMTNVTLRLAASSGPTSYSVCNQPPLRPDIPVDRNPMPTLYDPPITGEMAANACYPNYNNTRSTENHLRTTLSPEIVLEHYARQLQDSGWTPGGSANVPVGRTWARRDSTGAATEVTLTIAASPKGTNCRDVTMQVRGPAKP